MEPLEPQDREVAAHQTRQEREVEKVDWMNSMDDWRKSVNIQLETVGRALVDFKTDLQANTDATGRIEKNTKDTVDAFNAIQGGMKALGFISKLFGYLTVIATACVGTWYYFTHGFTLPPR